MDLLCASPFYFWLALPLRKNACTCHRSTGVYLWGQSRQRLIFTRDIYDECIDKIIFDQVHRTAAKTRARQARAEASRLPPRNLNHRVEFGATDLIVVTQTFVRCVHQLAECCVVVSFRCIDRLQHARVFSDDVPRAQGDNGR